MIGAVLVTPALFNPHHAFLESISIVTTEAHPHGPGLGWGAAPAICAGPTVVWLVPPHAGAPSIGEVHGLLGFLCSGAFLAVLGFGW